MSLYVGNVHIFEKKSDIFTNSVNFRVKSLNFHGKLRIVMEKLIIFTDFIIIN